MGLLSKIAPLAALAFGILFVGNILVRPVEARESAAVVTESGTALGYTLGSLGTGIQGFGEGIGGGVVGLLKPIKYISDMIYGSTISGAANSGAVAQNQIETDSFAISHPSSTTFTGSSGSDNPNPSRQPAVSTTGWTGGKSPSATIGGVTFGGQSGWGL